MKEYLISIFDKSSAKLPYLKDIQIGFEIPKIELHGDLSCNAAMLLTKQLKKKPRDIAQEIINSLDIDHNIIAKVEIAGPGFINFFFQSAFIVEIIKEIRKEKDNYGRSNDFMEKRANVEFVSSVEAKKTVKYPT